MIDEKLLIETMQWKMREAGTSDWNRCLDEVERFIKEFPQVGGWIPVTEKLPEEGYGVLATVNGKHNNTTFIEIIFSLLKAGLMWSGRSWERCVL